MYSAALLWPKTHKIGTKPPPKKQSFMKRLITITQFSVLFYLKVMWYVVLVSSGILGNTNQWQQSLRQPLMLHKQ